MGNPKYFISVDWGTSNFRIRVVDTASLKIVVEHQTDQGIKKCYQKFLAQSDLNQFQFFSEYLLSQVQQLPTEYHKLIIVLSGMASANIGMLELDYAAMPFGQKGNDLVKKHLTLLSGHQVILISGAKSKTGMMRGEEIQALGLTEYINQYGDGILLLPGTHSKHLKYQQGQFTDLKTFMTGELFELLSKKSILENNVQPSSFTSERKNAFLQGVELGFQKKLSSSLFSIRAKHLLQKSNKEDNYYFLSGLLIGDELSYLSNWKENLFLAAPNSTKKLYQLAFQKTMPNVQLIIFENKIIDLALLKGQQKILNLHDC